MCTQTLLTLCTQTYIVYTKEHNVYTLREFRANTKQAFDEAQKHGGVEISRGKVRFSLVYLGEEDKYPNRPQDHVLKMGVLVKGALAPGLKTLSQPDEVVDYDLGGSIDIKLCKHGFPPTMCKFAKPAKPCK